VLRRLFRPKEMQEQRKFYFLPSIVRMIKSGRIIGCKSNSVSDYRTGAY
jgi:hypothetical protein